MTKEELDRIKKAYSSGLKVQIWFNGYWKDFDVRDYSMYSDPFSENRQYRIVGSDYADIAEKRIAELEKENAELKVENEANENGAKKYAEFYFETNNQLTKAKEIIKEFVQWATWQGSNCPNFKSIQDKAEQFLKE